MRDKKLPILLITIFLLSSLSLWGVKPIKGSNIYTRIFFFYFPISKEYDFTYIKDGKNITLDIDIKKGDIKREPRTPPIFETDLKVKIQEIPTNKSGKFTFPITIRCNKKVNFKTGNFTLLNNGTILIVKGYVDDLLLMDISDNEYFHKRFQSRYPLYFDLRLKLVP